MASWESRFRHAERFAKGGEPERIDTQAATKPASQPAAKPPAIKPQAAPAVPQDFTEHARKAATMMLHKHGHDAKPMMAGLIHDLRKQAMADPKIAAKLQAAEHIRHFLDAHHEDYEQVHKVMGSGPSKLVAKAGLQGRRELAQPASSNEFELDDRMRFDEEPSAFDPPQRKREDYRLIAPMADAFKAAEEGLRAEAAKVSHPEDKQRYLDQIDELKSAMQSGNEKAFASVLADSMGADDFGRYAVNVNVRDREGLNDPGATGGARRISVEPIGPTSTQPRRDEPQPTYGPRGVRDHDDLAADISNTLREMAESDELPHDLDDVKQGLMVYGIDWLKQNPKALKRLAELPQFKDIAKRLETFRPAGESYPSRAARNGAPSRYALDSQPQPLRDVGQAAPKARGYIPPPRPVVASTEAMPRPASTGSAPPRGTPIARGYIPPKHPLAHHVDLARGNHGDGLHARLNAAKRHFEERALAGDHEANRGLMAVNEMLRHAGPEEALPPKEITRPLARPSVPQASSTGPQTSNLVYRGEHKLPSAHDPVIDKFFHDDTHSHRLAHGEEVNRKPIRTGKNGAFDVHFAGDVPGQTFRGVWKPAAMDKTAELRDHVPAGNSHGHESAAWETAKHLGIDAVPTTVSREMPHPRGAEVGSVQRWVDSVPALLSAKKFDDPDLPKHAAFDHVIGNNDRHTNNWKVDADGRHVLIDHGLAFPDRDSPHSHVSELYRHAVQNQMPIPADVAEWDAKWPQIERSLRRHNLSEAQIDRVHQRIAEVSAAAKQRKTFADLHASYNGKIGIAGL